MVRGAHPGAEQVKVWQEPGEEARAKWTCLTKEADWKKKGGAWYKGPYPLRGRNTPPLVYLIIVVRGTERMVGHKPGIAPYYAYAKHIDLARVTLPEVRDLLGEEWNPDCFNLNWCHGWEARFLLAATSKGLGVVVGGVPGNTASHVRTKAKKLAEEYIEQHHPDSDLKILSNALSSGQSLHHRRWERLREQSPVEYMAGFISGMQRCNSGEEEGEEYLAGWRHGWEYAVGKVPLPQWFVQSSQNGTEGR